MLKLKVLQICESANAGVGRHTLDLCEGLRNLGHEVHLAFSGKRIDDGFKNHMSILNGVQYVQVDLNRLPHPSDANAILTLGRYIKSHGPFDLVHGQSSKGGAIARIVGVVYGIPVVYTPHCISTMVPTFGRINRSVFRWIEWALSLRTAQILCTSQEELDHIHGFGVPLHKLRIVHVGVGQPPEANRQAVRQRLGLPEDCVIVGFIGRLTDQKNPEMLLNAFALAASNFPAARLAFIGTGELLERSKELTKALQIDDRVYWLGYQDGYQSLPAFDVLAVPSRYETGPYVMLEAMTVGIPVVITSVGRAQEVIESGVNGFIVQVEDVPGMADCLQKLIESTELQTSISVSAIKKSSEFSSGKMVEETLDAYIHILKRNSRKTAIDSTQNEAK